jgi:PAS domain S-box-containing protein
LERPHPLLPILRRNRGEMAARVDAFDWSQTSIGPSAQWPQSLRLALGICLNSGFPMFVWWGPQLINIYNDAYVPILRARHPAALGQPAQEVWGDIWETLQPETEAVLSRGEATWNERRELLLQRGGKTESGIFTWSYSPVMDEAGSVGGLYCVCIEETPRMRIEQQRDQLLSQVQSERARLAQVFSRSPAFIGILNGPDHRIDFFNERFQQLVGRAFPAAHPVRLALPELVSQGFVDLLDRVYRTGEPYVGTAVRVELRVDPAKAPEEAYLDFVYQPLRDAAGEVTGILVHGVDVTEQNRREARDRFLLALDDELRPQVDQQEIVVTCTRLLGVHLAVDRCAFCSVHDDEDSYEVIGEYNRHTSAMTGPARFSDFGVDVPQVLRSDAPYVVRDIGSMQPAPSGLPSFRRLMIQAAVAVPLFREGKLTAVVGVHQSTPRDWRTEEISLLRQVANRCREALERAQGARDLLESESRFRHMGDFAPVMIWMTGAGGGAEYLNRCWSEFTGQTPAEAADSGWLDALHPEDAPDVYRTFMLANSRREPVSLEYRLRRQDGEYRWCAASALPRRRGDGAFLGYVGTVVDINDRRLAEESLAAENAVLEMVATGTRLSKVLDEIIRTLERQSSHGALFSLLMRREDGEQLVLAAGPSLPPGFREELAIPAPDAAVGAWPQDDPRWQAFAAAAAAHGLHAAYGSRLIGAAGYLLGVVTVFTQDRRPAHTRDRNLARLGARLAGIVIEKHLVDRRIGEALAVEQEARAQAERAARAKDEFLATLSHELRTPLNAILGWVDLMKTSASDGETAARGIEVIERNARIQAAIVDDLLDMSAIISGKLRLDVRMVQLEPIIAAAVDIARAAADAKRIHLVNVAGAEGAMVLGDPDRLQQMVWNLLSNAVKFTPDGGRVEVALRWSGTLVEIAVSDNGEGIEADFLPHVFDRFRQADASTTRRHTGLGLGLSIVRKLAEMHGGSVSAFSEGPGRGSCFVLSLPLASRG